MGLFSQTAAGDTTVGSTPAWAMSAIAVHVAGSLVMTLAGIATVTWFKSS